jgi:TP901 family phage tail tape measure protein
MAGKLTASFILKLEDQLSGPLAKIEKAFAKLVELGKKLGLGGFEKAQQTLDKGAAAAGKMATAVGKITTQSTRARDALGRFVSSNEILDQGAESANRMATGIGRIWQMAQRASSALGQMANRAGRGIKNASDKIGVIGGVAAGYSVMEPIKAYAEQENALRHIAITEKKSGPAVEEEIARLSRNLNAEGLATGQSSVELAKAYNFLITTGMPASEVDKLMPAHARAATAYNISSESMGQAVFALADTMKISPEQMPSALASMAYAAKEGHFSVEDFSHFLPTVSASTAKLGMTGRGSADEVFAALETVRKGTGDAGTAATDLKDMLDYIVSPFGAHSFAKAGIDLPGMLKNAEKQGVNPLDAVLGKLQKMTAGKSPVETAQILGTVFHNQQARDAALALLRNLPMFKEMQGKFGAIDDKTVSTDFASAFRAPIVQVRIFSEEMAQLERRLGQGFAPIVHVLNEALDFLAKKMEALDKIFPGSADKALAVGAGFLIVVAALGALSVVLPAITAGFELLMALFDPFVLVAAAIAAVAYDIYNNWSTFEPFFRQLWNGIKEMFQGASDFVMGWVTGDWQRSLKGIEEMFSGVSDFYGAEWKIIGQLFTDFSSWVDGWTSGAWSQAIHAIVQPFKDAENEIVNSTLGRMMGLSGTPGKNPFAPAGGGDHGDGDGEGFPGQRDTTPGLANTTMTIGLDPGLRIVKHPEAMGGLNFDFKPLSPLGQALGRP